MKRILVDTNVLIELWRNPGSEPAVFSDCIKTVNTIIHIEFLQGANSRQKTKAKNFLDQFEHLRLDADTCDTAVSLIDKYSEKEGLRLADALIAATCLVNSLDLLTINRRHFQNVKGLNLI